MTWRRAVREHRTLRILGLARNFGGPLSNDGAVELGRCLRTNGCLRIVDLGMNEIEDRGAAGLADGLCENQSARMIL